MYRIALPTTHKVILYPPSIRTTGGIGCRHGKVVASMEAAGRRGMDLLMTGATGYTGSGSPPATRSLGSRAPTTRPGSWRGEAFRP